MRILTAAFVCVLATALPASAQDASGTWSATFNTPNGTRPATLTITRTGEKLAGNIASDQGEVAIEGTQKGAEVRFTFVVQTGNGPFNIAMSGKQDGDSLAGVVDYNGVGQGDWSARRTTGTGSPAASQSDKTAIDVSGPWALEVQTAGGGGTPTVTFKQDGDKLTGQYVGQFGESAVTGTLKGSEITFSFEVNVQGTNVRVVYSGTVEKDAMKGTVTFGDLGEGTFTGKRK